MLLVSWRSWRSLLRREVRQRGRRLLLRRILFVGIRRGHLCLPCVTCLVMVEDERKLDGKRRVKYQETLFIYVALSIVFWLREITKNFQKISEQWRGPHCLC
jgi:hypothetical protein